MLSKSYDNYDAPTLKRLFFSWTSKIVSVFISRLPLKGKDRVEGEEPYQNGFSASGKYFSKIMYSKRKGFVPQPVDRFSEGTCYS